MTKPRTLAELQSSTVYNADIASNEFSRAYGALFTPQLATTPAQNFCPTCGKRSGPAGHIHTCTPPRHQRLSWQESAEELVRKTHIAKGRHRMQIAMCDLYDFFGLTCVRPERRLLESK